MVINTFAVSFPEFKLNEIINPDEANANNADIADKLNELISKLNVVASDGYVGTNQLADGSVISVKLGDGAVLRGKIADGAVNLSKVDLASFDGRYYTEAEIDAKLLALQVAINAKTNRLGNHEGTWQGLQPMDFQAGQQAVDIAQLRTDLDTHRLSVNPHGLTASDIDAFSVHNIEELLFNVNGLLRTKRIVGSKDENGVYTEVHELRQSNDTLYSKQVLSEPDADGKYTVLTETFYDVGGGVVDEHVYDLVLDDGEVLEAIKR